MHTAVRSPLTAGVALVGAGAIAVSPLVVPPDDIDIAVPRITSAAVDLMANPLAIYGQAIGDALTNAGLLVQRFTDIAGPTLSPAFLEFLAGVGTENATALVDFLNPASLIEYANGLPATIQTYSTALQSFIQTVGDRVPTQVPAALEEALGLLAQGDFQGAVNTLLSIPLDLVGLDILAPLGATEAFLNALLPLPIVADVAEAALGGLLPGINGAGLFLALVAPVVNLGGALGTGVQGVIDAVEAGDPEGVVNAMIAVPGTIVDGVLNGGYGPGLPILGTPFPGLLSPPGALLGIGSGTITAFLTLADTILTNLGWAPPDQGSPAAVNSLPSEGAATFALNVGDTGSGAADDSLGADALSLGGTTGDEGGPAAGTAAEDENGSTGEENTGEENTGEENAADEDGADSGGSDAGEQGGSDAGEQGGSDAGEQGGSDAGEQGGTGSDDGSASGDDDSTDTPVKDGNKSEPGDVGGGAANSNDNGSGPAADQTDGGSTGAGDATGGDNAAGGGSEGTSSDS